MADAIRRIVQEIVFICRVRSVQISDTLAAFIQCCYDAKVAKRSMA